MIAFLIFYFTIFLFTLNYWPHGDTECQFFAACLWPLAWPPELIGKAIDVVDKIYEPRESKPADIGFDRF